MHNYLLLTLFSCFLYQADIVTISWSEDLKLQWNDFKDNPKPVGDAVATTASGISFGYSTTKSSSGLVDYSFHITAHFYPDRSWHINTPLSDNVLAHERLHFDITELYARKFKQRLANTTFTNEINIEMEHINKAINAELAKLQNKYDAETNHSQNVEQQITWQTYIVSELNKLSIYGD